MATLRDELFRQRFTLDGMLSEGFALLEERPEKNSCSAQWAAFGVPVENVRGQPARFRAPAPSGTAKAHELRSGFTGGRRHGA